ncbi:MAG: hypothetical protein HOP29_04655 [Phycisphaerales bacterium]|nr:hypothetical protein [Phycisphaerales bacterium]
MTLFEIYRRLLFLAVGVYAVVRSVAFIWRWELAGRGADRTESLLRRYVVSLLVRVRALRFWWEFVQLAALAAILVFLLKLHRPT